MCHVTPLLRDSDSVCIQAFSLPLLRQVHDFNHIFLVSATLKHRGKPSLCFSSKTIFLRAHYAPSTIEYLGLKKTDSVLKRLVMQVLCFYWYLELTNSLCVGLSCAL